MPCNLRNFIIKGPEFLTYDFISTSRPKIMASVLPYVCLSNIFQHIDKDQKSLYSCTFINKQWCMSALPELWRNPFENQESKQQISLTNTYIACLPQVIRQKLRITSTLTQPVTFNYPAY